MSSLSPCGGQSTTKVPYKDSNITFSQNHTQALNGNCKFSEHATNILTKFFCTRCVVEIKLPSKSFWEKFLLLSSMNVWLERKPNPITLRWLTVLVLKLTICTGSGSCLATKLRQQNMNQVLFLLLLSISTDPIFWWSRRARTKNLGLGRDTPTHGSPTNSQRHSEHVTSVSPRILSFLVTSTNSQGHSGSVQLTKGTKVSTTQLAS